MREVDFRCEWVVDLDAVDHHDGVIRFCTSNANLRISADRPQTTDCDTGLNESKFQGPVPQSFNVVE